MTKDRSMSHKASTAIHNAYREGDLLTVREVLGNPPDFPNSRQPPELAVGDHALEYAIYWSPFAFIQQLLRLGAESNYSNHAGFPSLIAALSSGRRDSHQILELLLDYGADMEQRGLNDWTPLHYAVVQRNLEAVKMLLDHGANLAVRIRVDDCTSPLEDAEAINFNEAVDLLRDALARNGGAKE